MSTEENKSLFRGVVKECYNKRDLGVLDKFFAADVVDHAAPPGLPPGLEAGRILLGAFFSAFPDLQYTLEDVMAEGDKVVARATIRGTQTGEFAGIPPTGKPIMISVIDIWRVANGKLVEHWHVLDQLSMLQQLGVIPSPRPSAG